MFRQDGEERFRQLETDALDLLRLKNGEVIATGGGLPCRPGRIDVLKALGTVVWLKGDVHGLVERAGRAGDRPMIAGRSDDEIDALYRQREPYYGQADIIVATDGLGVDQVVNRIVAALRDRHAARV
ncbi:MAG: hypothetical protein HY216_08210 [Candidatus Rokubacteria bacterium]|nr:hypothetical protein [Candidatus Rokubacteria bacterium]